MSEVVHFEPYPVVESVDILDKAGVKHFPFSGVTFNGYFRLLGGMPNANVPLKCGGIAYIEYAYQAIVVSYTHLDVYKRQAWDVTKNVSTRSKMRGAPDKCHFAGCPRLSNARGYLGGLLKCPS